MEEGDVSLRLVRNKDEAIQLSREGVVRLGEFALAKELAWVQKDLRALERVKPLYITMGSGSELL